jgi:hypothetical protein
VIGSSVWPPSGRLISVHQLMATSSKAQIAVGGLIGKSFGPVILQAYLTTDVYEKNYGGHDTRLWGRFIIPVWLPSTPPTTPLYRRG